MPMPQYQMMPFLSDAVRLPPPNAPSTEQSRFTSSSTSSWGCIGGSSMADAAAATLTATLEASLPHTYLAAIDAFCRGSHSQRPETEGTSAHPSCQLASARVPGGGVPKGIQVGSVQRSGNFSHRRSVRDPMQRVAMCARALSVAFIRDPLRNVRSS